MRQKRNSLCAKFLQFLKLVLIFSLHRKVFDASRITLWEGYQVEKCRCELFKKSEYGKDFINNEDVLFKGLGPDAAKEKMRLSEPFRRYAIAMINNVNSPLKYFSFPKITNIVGKHHGVPPDDCVNLCEAEMKIGKSLPFKIKHAEGGWILLAKHWKPDRVKEWFCKIGLDFLCEKLPDLDGKSLRDLSLKDLAFLNNDFLNYFYYERGKLFDLIPRTEPLLEIGYKWAHCIHDDSTPKNLDSFECFYEYSNSESVLISSIIKRMCLNSDKIRLLSIVNSICDHHLLMPCLGALESLIVSLVGLGLMQDARSILEYGTNRDFFFSSITYEKFMWGCLKNGDPHPVIYLYSYLSSLDVYAPPPIHKAAIKAYLLLGKVDSARNLLNRILENDAVQWNRYEVLQFHLPFIYWAFHCGLESEFLYYLELIKKQDMEFNDEIVALILTFYARKKNFQSFYLHAKSAIESQNYGLNAHISYLIALLDDEKTGDLDRGMQVFDTMGLDPETYEYAVICILSRCKSEKMAKHVLKWLLTKNNSLMNIDCYRIILKMRASSGKYARAFDFPEVVYFFPFFEIKELVKNLLKIMENDCKNRFRGDATKLKRYMMAIYIVNDQISLANSKDGIRSILEDFVHSFGGD